MQIPKISHYVKESQMKEVIQVS